MMKESINNCFENAETERLNGFFEKYKGEQMPEESLARLRKKMLGEGVKKPAKKRGFKRLIPALAAAACLLVGLGIAYKAGVFDKPNQEALQNLYISNGEALKLYPSKKTKDKLDIRNLPSDAASIFASASRLEYCHVRFFESADNVYAIFGELSGIFSFDGNSFTRTGPTLKDVQYFDSGAYGAYVYIPGSWYCWGQDSGLYRFKLEDGRIERFVSTDETVVSVASDGPNIYYSSYIGDYENATFSLKRVNVESGKITVLIENASYYISDLKFANGNLYFESYRKGVFYITPDMYLHAILLEDDSYVKNYAVDGDNVYIEMSDSKIFEYDHTGNKLFEYKFIRNWSDAENNNNLYFGDFTVYNGRLVCYDKNGVYLLDIASGEREKIVDDPWNEWWDHHHYSYLSETVFNGKLYFEIGNNIVYEYDNGRIREFDLSEETVIETSIRLIRYDPYGFGTKVMTLPPSEKTTSIINYLVNSHGNGEICEKLSDEAFDENASEMPAEPGTMWLEIYSEVYRVSPNFDKVWRVDGHFGEGMALFGGTGLYHIIEDILYEDYELPFYGSVHHTFDTGSIDVKLKSIKPNNDAIPSYTMVVELVSSVDQTIDVRLECAESSPHSEDIKRAELKAGIATEIELCFDGVLDGVYRLEITIGNMRMETRVLRNTCYFSYYVESRKLEPDYNTLIDSSLKFCIESIDINEDHPADSSLVLRLDSTIDQEVVLSQYIKSDRDYQDTEFIDIKAGISAFIEIELDEFLSDLRSGTPYWFKFHMDAVSPEGIHTYGRLRIRIIP